MTPRHNPSELRRAGSGGKPPPSPQKTVDATCDLRTAPYRRALRWRPLRWPLRNRGTSPWIKQAGAGQAWRAVRSRSEEHTSELQSLAYLVCRLLLEKKKKHTTTIPNCATPVTSSAH